MSKPVLLHRNIQLQYGLFDHDKLHRSLALSCLLRSKQATACPQPCEAEGEGGTFVVRAGTVLLDGDGDAIGMLPLQLLLAQAGLQLLQRSSAHVLGRKGSRLLAAVAVKDAEEVQAGSACELARSPSRLGARQLRGASVRSATPPQPWGEHAA